MKFVLGAFVLGAYLRTWVLIAQGHYLAALIGLALLLVGWLVCLSNTMTRICSSQSE